MFGYVRDNQMRRYIELARGENIRKICDERDLQQPSPSPSKLPMAALSSPHLVTCLGLDTA